MANLGDGAVVEVFVMGLAHGPGLELMRGITRGVQVVVLGDLGELGAMAALVTLMMNGPGQKLPPWTGLAGGIGGRHWRAGGAWRQPWQGSWISLQSPATL